MEARLHYPMNDPPEVIELRGVRWSLERTATREWNSFYSMWVCPHCGRGDMSKNKYCPDCGVRFIGSDTSAAIPRRTDRSVSD